MTKSLQNLTFKFLVIGNSLVGKTSLVKRLCSNEFSESCDPTIGIEFMTHKIKINNTKVYLQIWDTAGQEKYQSLGKMYYRDSLAVLLVFSLTDYSSFEDLEKWYNDARKLCHPNAKILLVCNKVDLIEQRCVSKFDVDQFAKARNIEYIETSAKDNTNVEEAFNKLARNVLQAVATNEIQLAEKTNPQPNAEKTQEKSSCC